tara:strand:- start:3453 stop:3890 length:438 start_codon:yes stop_codon:yes gene_type:complete
MWWPSYQKYLQMLHTESRITIEKNMKVDDIIGLEALDDNITHKTLKIVTRNGKTKHPQLEAVHPDMHIDTIYKFNYVILPISRREVRFVHKNDIVMTYPDDSFHYLEMIVKDHHIILDTDYNISSCFLEENDLYKSGKLFHHKER